jgi:hypothetical protein
MIFPFLLPAHQESTRAVDPGMGAFHDPATRSIAGSENLFLLFSTPTTDVRNVTSGLQPLGRSLDNRSPHPNTGVVAALRLAEARAMTTPSRVAQRSFIA